MYRGLLTKRDKERKKRKWRMMKGGLAVFLTVTLACGAVFGVMELKLNAAEGGESNSEPAFLQPEPFQLTAMTNEEAAKEDGEERTKGIWYEPLDNEEILIVLDPGHGGEDEGCAYAGVEEKDLNLQIARRVKEGLLELGYRVVMTREDDREISREERVQAAYNAGGHIFVSIHQNASEAKDAKGMEVWYDAGAAGDSKSEESKRLAKLIHKFAVESTQANGRGTKSADNLFVVRETAMPSCLVETGFLSNNGERRKLSDTKYQESIANGIVNGIDLYFHPKTMYLTFDDGPSEENTTAILDILKKKSIKATFFLVGENVKKHPEIAKRIVQEGHTIGIHCNSHDYKVLYKNAESYEEDFQQAYDIIFRVTGVKPKLFRFPGGSINAYNKKVYKDIIERMTEEGFIYFDWNASLEDAVKKASPETLLQNAKSSTLGRKKVVMLAHDIVYETTLCLEELIDSFPEYRMLPLTEEVTPIQF